MRHEGVLSAGRVLSPADVGRVLFFRPAVIVLAILAITLPAYAQNATPPASAKASGRPRPSAVRGADVNKQNPDGSTPLQWAVYNGDVAEAKRLLRYTSMGVSEIAYELGFDDPAYFTRFFSQRTSMAPRAFRARAPRLEEPNR